MRINRLALFSAEPGIQSRVVLSAHMLSMRRKSAVSARPLWIALRSDCLSVQMAAAACDGKSHPSAMRMLLLFFCNERQHLLGVGREDSEWGRVATKGALPESIDLRSSLQPVIQCFRLPLA